MAVDKFFSLGVLTFSTHINDIISSCVLCTMWYILHIQMPKIWGASAPPSTHLSTALEDTYFTNLNYICGTSTDALVSLL